MFRAVTNKLMEEFDRNVSGAPAFVLSTLPLFTSLLSHFRTPADPLLAQRTMPHLHAASPIRVALLATLTVKTFNVQGVAEI